ncbi:isoprenyl transferase [Brevibacterium luteolum]|uniref:isoprenyl transferase n=1 Tax=Brevibacterium luteolum TaxID=199591 RepID=UPI001C22A1C4|nr:isoprenyl transferase [Brevibacterium luteolum]MBU8577983.1 isoprenyl transferase [Brevibacterium luteolum]
MAGSPLGWLYRLYDRRVKRQLEHGDDAAAIPRHVGVITDGNRRWAKEFGKTTADGHRMGAGKIVEFLGWCEELGVEVVTLYVLSKENLARSADEVAALTEIISDLVDQIAGKPSVSVQLVGDLATIPEPLRTRLADAQERSNSEGHGKRMTVNVAVGYGGRQEIVNAVKCLLREHAAAGENIEEIIEALSEEEISKHLYTKGQPDPDLIIRSSGEQRLSGFMMWQSAYSEFYFCEAYWPDFRRTDFLRAVRAYGNRNRRFGR